MKQKLLKWIEDNYIYAGDSKADSGDMGQYNRALDDIKKYIYENS